MPGEVILSAHDLKKHYPIKAGIIKHTVGHVRAVDGVSLTVSSISDATVANQWFEVSLIPETLTATTLGERVVGEQVNIETDIVARHVERILALSSPALVPSAPPIEARNAS